MFDGLEQTKNVHRYSYPRHLVSRYGIFNVHSVMHNKKLDAPSFVSEVVYTIINSQKLF